MKTIYFASIYVLFCAISCQNSEQEYMPVSTEVVNNPITASTKESDVDIAEIEFNLTEYDFGEIIQGEKVTFSFGFKSIGDGALIISDVSSTCGCTVSSWPKDPILPDSEGDIVVVFDSEGKSGKVVKEVSVLTNAVPSTRVLKILANVNSFESN